MLKNNKHWKREVNCGIDVIWHNIGVGRFLTLPRKQVPEHLPQVGEVRLVIEAQRATVLKEGYKLHRVTLAQNLQEMELRDV